MSHMTHLHIWKIYNLFFYKTNETNQKVFVIKKKTNKTKPKKEKKKKQFVNSVVAQFL